MAAKQELSPLLPEEVERLRAEYGRLPVHDPRRRLLRYARSDTHGVDLKAAHAVAHSRDSNFFQQPI
jgi:hypothetical protein